MRKRAKKFNNEIELFPFLSVLACTIGSLILLIIVITTQTLDSTPQVKIIAKTEGGKNITKQPRYLESTKDGVIIYPSKTLVKKSDLKKDNSELFKFISEIKNRRNKEYIIVAIRPQSIESFLIVRNLIEEAKIDIGYEPIEDGWTLKITDK